MIAFLIAVLINMILRYFNWKTVIADASFSESERLIRNLLEQHQVIQYENKSYDLILCAKPTVKGGGGEPKTDIYVKAKDQQSKDIIEFKISYKKPNYAFVENKITSTRAHELYGKNWSQEVQSQIKKITEKFLGAPIVFFNKKGNVEEGSITLGWRYEIEIVKHNRALSTVLEHSVATHVLKNRQGSPKYIDCIVNDKKIKNSGIPNYYLDMKFEDIDDAQYVYDHLQPIDGIIESDVAYRAAFLAQNYRSHIRRQEGNNRDLAVWINWYVCNGKLECKHIFGEPLEQKSGSALENLKQCICKLGIDPDKDFNIHTLKDKLGNTVKIHKLD